MGVEREEISRMELVASTSEMELAWPPPTLKTSPRNLEICAICRSSSAEHVFDKQDVAHLFSLPAKIGERQREPVRDGPPHHPALIHLAELADAGDDPEAVHDDRQIKGLRIFLAGGVGDQFAESVDAALAAIHRKVFRYAMRGSKPAGRCSGARSIPRFDVVVVARGRFVAGQIVQLIGTVDSVGAPENQRNTANTGIFQDVNGAQAVVGDVEKWIGVAGNDGRLRAGIANEFNAGGKISEIFGIAHVTVKKGNAVPLEIADILLGAAADEIVHHGDLMAPGAEMQRDMRTDETATARNENVQEGNLPYFS